MRKILPFAAIILAACTPSAYLNIGGATWRTTEAFSATLYSVGVIETTGRNRFDPKGGKVTLNDFPIEALTTFHSEETATASLKAEGKWTPSVATTAAELEAKKEKRLKGVYVVFRNQDTYGLINKLNEPVNQQTLTHLKEESKPVIVTGVAVVYDNDIYKNTELRSGVNASFNSGSGSPVIELKGSSKSEIKASFSDGTVFAYEYSRIEWDTNSSAPKVKHLTVDRPANSGF
ncbi:MAG: hypothetical protein Q8L15_08195 [Methylobacter sp.]|nr:hypothetical protein [Methylobacter sp.]